MYYSKSYFGKELNEVTFEDIEHFFSEAKDESDKIEFKSYHKPQKGDEEPITGVIKAIAALLNSEGGLVIWGAPEGKVVQGKKEKIFQGPLCLVEKLYEKDSFISTIADVIKPSPSGVKFQRFEKNGKYAYIIDVEQSLYSPHQFKGIYYMRLDGQTRIAPHYYVEALFRKVTFPNLEGYLKITNLHRIPYTESDGIVMEFEIIIYNWSRLQNEHDVYYRIKTDGDASNRYSSSVNGRIYKENEIIFRNASPILFYHEPLIMREKIFFPTANLKRNKYEGFVLFYFGGKQSPLKLSHYKFSFASLYTSTPFEDDNDCITFIEENKYAYEIDIRDSDQVKSMIGR